MSKARKRRALQWRRLSSKRQPGFGNTVYFLNCGIGVIMLIIGLVFAVIYSDTLSQLSELFPDVVPFIIAAALAFISSMSFTTAPSVSLEGKNFSVIRSLPVDGRDILSAKLVFHQISPRPLRGAIVLRSYGADLISALLIIVAILAFNRVGATN